MSCEGKSTSILWMALLMWECVSSEPSADVDRPFACYWAFLVMDYIINVLWTDGLWFDNHVIGSIFTSCFWNWGQMLACFSRIYMLCSREVTQENFCNLFRIYGLFWSMLRAIFNDFSSQNSPQHQCKESPQILRLAAVLNWIQIYPCSFDLDNTKEFLLVTFYGTSLWLTHTGFFCSPPPSEFPNLLVLLFPLQKIKKLLNALFKSTFFKETQNSLLCPPQT